MCCKADTILHILWNAKHFSMSVEKNLVWSEYMDFHISINPFIAYPDVLTNVCCIYFARGTSLPYRDEVTTDPMFVNVKNNIFPLDFQYNYSKGFNPALPCTAWNFGCGLLKFACGTKMLHKNDLMYLSYTKFHVVVLVDTRVKQFHFIMNVCTLNVAKIWWRLKILCIR